jgi:cytochrome c biogenesis protein CcmG/thiol:disulfide interchange protein DsbE
VSVKRNSAVIGLVVLILALFAFAGWANWKHRQQLAAAKRAVPAAPATADTGAAQASPLLGKAAPAFTLEDLQGRKVSLADFKGKAVLVNFWATWCGPCKLETPWLVELRNKYAAEGFEVVGISTEGDDLKPADKAGLARDRAAVAKFAATMKVPYPMLLGGDSLSEKFGGLDAMPTSFYLDRNGVVVAEQMGMSSEAEMEANIRKAMGK